MASSVDLHLDLHWLKTSRKVMKRKLLVERLQSIRQPRVVPSQFCRMTISANVRIRVTRQIEPPNYSPFNIVKRGIIQKSDTVPHANIVTDCT
jgi:hypothetical protein